MIDFSLLQDFMEEAYEHLEEMESSLLHMEEKPGDEDILNDIFRSVHTIKGAAQFVGIDGISELTHKLENLLDRLRQKELTPSMEVVDLLIAGKDRISILAGELERHKEERSSIDDLVTQIESIDGSENAAAAPASCPEKEKEAEPASEFEGLLDDFFHEPGTEDPAALLDGENTDEENDPELFTIFIGQLREGLSELLRLETECAGGGGRAGSCLDRSEEIIRSLSSAANYMGYEKLTAFYSRWREALASAGERQKSDGGVPPGIHRTWVQALLDKFPAAAPSESVETGGGTATEKAAGEEELASAIEDLFPEGEAQTDTPKAPDETREGELAAAMAMLEKEVIDEEQDAELYDIFIGQLTDGIAELHQLNEELSASAEPSAALEACVEVLQRLALAANYMGYDRLGGFYGRWRDLLQSSAGRAREGFDVSDDLIEPWTRVLTDKFSIVPASAPEEEEPPSVEAGVSRLIDDIFRDPAEEEIEHLLQGEDFEEEYDAELFQIFRDQLSEGVDALQGLTARLGSDENSDAILLECSRTLDHMSSSANYMGYDRLTKFYELWQERIESARSLLRDGEEIPADINDRWMDALLLRFPEGEPAGSGPAADPDSAGKGSPQETSAEPPAPEEDPLFRKLSMAFDSDQAQVPTETGDAIDEVITEMLAGGGGKLPLFETASHSEAAGMAETPDADTADQDGEVAAEPPMRREKTAPLPGGASDEAGGGEEPPEIELEFPHEEARAAEENAVVADEEAARPSERIVRQSIRVDADKIDYLMNEVGELVVSRAYFFQLFNEMRMLQQDFKETLGLDQKELKPLRELTFRLGEASVALGRVSNELQEGVMKVRMLPVAQLFNRYPRLVRDLVHHTNKKVRLEVRGEETELDKMIIEEISDPLIHLIRNAVDHGIEPAAEREASGKSPEGHLLLEAYHESNHIVIEISDDGRGIDPDIIRRRALEKGLYSADELARMTSSELYQVIMLPGFSTASIATKTSGRGVGMDVVKKNIEKLNGTFDVESDVGKGTMMRIKIPLTLAIIQALMVRVGQDLFTIPLPAVEETLKISQDMTTTIEGVEVIHIRETTMPIFRLRALFGAGDGEEPERESFVVIVNAGNQLVGLVVDQLIGQEEVVIKPMADYLREESGFSGATIIGDGRVSLILDVHDLVKMAAKRNTIRRKTLRKFARMTMAEAQQA